MNRAAHNRWWLLAAVLATTYLIAMYLSGALPRSRQLIESDLRGVMATEPSAVLSVIVTAADHEFLFARHGNTWVRSAGPDDHEDALPAAQASALERAVKFMHTSAPVRAFAAKNLQADDVTQYGLDKPRISISLKGATQELLRAHFGAKNADGFLQYMQVPGRGELYLMSRFVGGEWQTVIDAEHDHSHAHEHGDAHSHPRPGEGEGRRQ